jgi:hypothetical protein
MTRGKLEIVVLGQSQKAFSIRLPAQYLSLS